MLAMCKLLVRTYTVYYGAAAVNGVRSRRSRSSAAAYTDWAEVKMASDGQVEYESILCVKPEVNVYRIPPRASNRAIRWGGAAGGEPAGGEPARRWSLWPGSRRSCAVSALFFFFSYKVVL